jgi:hypothetical protein
MLRRFGILLCAWTLFAQSPLKFMGRAVTITGARYDADDPEHFYPKGPAKICFEGSPRQCYSTEDGYGGDPYAEQIQLDKSTSALFFASWSGGVSGRVIRFALFRPGPRNELENLFPPDLGISDQGEHKWWTEPSISDAKIFMAADYVWGPGDCHVCDHRYIVSAYVLMSKQPVLISGSEYGLYDQYMTTRRYNPGESHILNSEKPEILARLKRVKQQSPR